MPIRRPLALVIGLLACSVALSAQAQETVRIGYQKSSTLITLLKTQGTLEKALKADDIGVSWHEFPSGLPLLEALNVGNVDISADVADTVPIFAQAAQAKLTYFAQEAPSPSAQAIVVRKDSPIQQLADLKGKNRGDQGGRHPLLIDRRAGQGRPGLFGYRAGLSVTGRWSRSVRKQQGRRLGHLGTLPHQRATPATDAHPRRWRRAGQLQALLPDRHVLRQGAPRGVEGGV